MPDGCDLIGQVRDKAVEDRRDRKIKPNQLATIRRLCDRMERHCLRMIIVRQEWVISPPAIGATVKIGESVSTLESYVADAELASAAITALGQILEAAGDAEDLG